MKGMPKVLEYLAVVLVQDALELAEKYPENPVHAHLLDHHLFEYETPCAISALTDHCHLASASFCS